MKITKKSPIVRQHYRAGVCAISSPTAFENDMPSRTECLAVALFSHRYRLAMPTARTIVELAGFGGRV